MHEWGQGMLEDFIAMRRPAQAVRAKEFCG
jgi:hypothetical protein